jgi:peptidoglycan-associated lipoprotein
MKTIQTFAAIVALASLVACGSKKPAASEPTGDETGGDTSAGKKRAGTGDTTPGGDSKSASSLGDVIYFAFDSNELSEESRNILNQNAEWLKEDPARHLTIEGHTDQQGTEEYNLGLGERRAKAAQDYLIHLGITADRIKIITFGEEKPAGEVDDKNRRSVFIANAPKK